MTSEKMEKLKEAKPANLLSEDELDDTAGGSCGEMADDIRILHEWMAGRPECPDLFGKTKIMFSGAEACDQLTKAWASLGVTANLSTEKDVANIYTLDGKQITREQALKHAQSILRPHGNNPGGWEYPWD